jgi:hypothetical protein
LVDSIPVIDQAKILDGVSLFDMVLDLLYACGDVSVALGHIGDRERYVEQGFVKHLWEKDREEFPIKWIASEERSQDLVGICRLDCIDRELTGLVIYGKYTRTKSSILITKGRLKEF